jgi:hypothetical protein
MKDAAERPGSEMDVLKFYIWLMLVMTLALLGFYWSVWNDVDTVRRSIAQGQAWKKEFAKNEAEIGQMLKVYETNNEEQAREAPETWFSTIWRSRGINDASVGMGPWKLPPRFDAKGKYYEEQIDMKFNPKSPLARQSILEFLHKIESSSTRLRVIELDVRRADKDAYDDKWAGGATIGYRHARTD